MAQKIVLISDPGIDGAFAIALALHDPDLEVVGLLATAGNVSAEQATKNIRIVIEQIDPERWPRLGAAPEVDYGINGAKLHGQNGLGNTDFPCVALHHLPAGEKLLGELVRQYPEELTIICLGPLTVLARAIDLHPELPSLIRRILVVGGTMHEPGNAGPVSEFHFFCDPKAARKVIHCKAPVTLIPLDMMRKVLFSPTDLLGMPADGSSTSRFLRQLVPFGIAATANEYGIEGFHLKDVLGIAVAALPEAIHTKHLSVDIETQGELTRGMAVFDRRSWLGGATNVDVVTDVVFKDVRQYMTRLLDF